MRELALFAGAGGGILGSKLLGWHTVCAVEIDPYCRDVLLRRQLDGHLDPFPIWDDIRTFDGRRWRGHIDIITGGFPCQDISAAGRGTGIGGEKSSLWFEMARVILEVRPQFVFVENSPMLTVRGIDRVLGSLAAMGFDAQWGVLGADDACAPHIRKRIWIRASRRATMADAEGFSQRKPPIAHDSEPGKWAARDVTCCCGEHMADATSNGLARQRKPETRVEKPQLERPGEHVRPWPSEPDVGRVAYGVANRVDRLRAIGNGQVPRVVALAWMILSGKPPGEEIEA